MDNTKFSNKENCMESNQKDFNFYKKFYEKHRIDVLQYKNLRKYFQLMVDNCLGVDYYNIAMDVYEADRICCKDITRKIKNQTIWQKIFRTLFK